MIPIDIKVKGHAYSQMLEKGGKGVLQTFYVPLAVFLCVCLAVCC